MGDIQLRPRLIWAIVGYLLLGLALPFTSKFLGASINTQTFFALGDGPVVSTPQISAIYTVSPTVLAIEIPAPTVEKGQQVPYVPQPNDKLRPQGLETRLTRDGVEIGTLVGANKDILFKYDRIEDLTFPRRIADNHKSYSITSVGDAAYTTATHPQTVFRKTKPVAFARNSSGNHWPTRHTLFLTLNAPLSQGNTYHLSFPGLGITDTTFTYQPTKHRSEAVHVSQLGFRPDDPLKVGYLSTWMGNGGGIDYPEGLGFSVINQQTNQTIYTGTASQVREQQQTEDLRGQDYTLTEVHRLDFSEVTQPGEYRLCVEGIGCSFDFKIAEDTWADAFFASARGFYHQRSGIAIGEPHTPFSRPRSFHPDDGLRVYQSGATLQEVDMGIGSRDTFEALNSQKTDVVVPNAWGGYFDAGDWDRRIQHLTVPRSLLELHNLFPDYFKSVNLNIPESANALPDILDEALWSLDFFRRLQTPEGGIRGGIQSAAEGGVYGEASWQESLEVMAYAPDVWSSYLYAGVAARAAFTLQSYDETLTNTYRESALKAMAYAESNYQSGSYDEGQLHHVKDQRNLSALELYRLTGEPQWHDLFLATTIFQNPAAEASIFGLHEQRDAAFLYARLTQPQLNNQLNSQLNDPSDSPLNSQLTSQLSTLEDGQVNASEGIALAATKSSGENAIAQAPELASAQTPQLDIDATVQANARTSFLRYADSLVALTNTTAFGWSKDHPKAPLGWGNGLGAPHGVNLLQAHALTQAEKYLVAGLSSTQFSGGANPDNLSYTTGLGDRTPQNPLIVDHRITGQAPPPGITLYGPADLSTYQNYWTIDEITGDTFPQPQNWPAVENFFDIYLYPLGAEFTVDYMTRPAYTWGYLAASDR